ncbi:DUF6090 family protein [Oceanihabitans sp.]|nr:DUF6090 family protein [Oceanihabitans sp.]
MIKFFRKIRKRLLTENKFSKYLLYAIGEIILVVIGIMIALQVNNWNQTRIKFNNDLQMYSKLYDDLNSEYLKIERNARQFSGYSRTYSHIYNETKGEALYNPNLNYDHVLWFHRYNMFIKEKYSGSFANITNDEIHNHLKSFISRENETNDAMNEWNEHQLKNVRPYLSKHGINQTKSMFNSELNGFADIINQTDLIDYSKLKEQFGSIEFDQLLFNMQFKTTWVHQNLVWMNENNLSFQNELKKELERFGLTENVIYWEKEKKNTLLLKEADAFYDSEDYLKSANKYKQAFEQMTLVSIGDRYNAACSFALAEDIESAFAQLHIIANEPYKYENYNWIIKDSDFNNLHNDPRWEEVIAIVKLNLEDE